MSDTLKGEEDVKKMVKQVISYDDGTETVIEYTALGDKIEHVEEVEEAEEAEQETEAEEPAEAAEESEPETEAEPDAEELPS